MNLKSFLGIRTLFFLILILSTISVDAHGGKDYSHSDIFKSMESGDKIAILMVHFGTTHDDTRELTIDALNQQVQSAFPKIEFREAYTSRIVIKRLNDRGITKLNPLEALNSLNADGYTHVLVQPSVIINGVEMESLQKNVDEVKSLFKDIRVGQPLLYTPNDYEKVIDALINNPQPNTAYIWVGHGTYDASTAQYAMLDYMLKAKGHKNHLVGTIEGYPDYATTLAQFKSLGLKKVVLLPFMFVFGDHAKNDIAADWKNDLQEEGYDVNVIIEGLGQNPKIRDIYVSHLKFIATHRKIDIIEKKKMYKTTGEKQIDHH